MCWEQSRRKRTIAASRSVATTTETNPETEATRRRRVSARPTDLKDSRSRPALSLWTNPEENRSPLDKLFQERSDTPKQFRLSRAGHRKNRAARSRLVLDGKGLNDVSA